MPTMDPCACLCRTSEVEAVCDAGGEVVFVRAYLGRGKGLGGRATTGLALEA